MVNAMLSEEASKGIPPEQSLESSIATRPVSSLNTSAPWTSHRKDHFQMYTLLHSP